MAIISVSAHPAVTLRLIEANRGSRSDGEESVYSSQLEAFSSCLIRDVRGNALRIFAFTGTIAAFRLRDIVVFRHAWLFFSRFWSCLFALQPQLNNVINECGTTSSSQSAGFWNNEQSHRRR
jgi:hypothetical protein